MRPDWRPEATSAGHIAALMLGIGSRGRAVTQAPLRFCLTSGINAACAIAPNPHPDQLDQRVAATRPTAST